MQRWSIVGNFATFISLKGSNLKTPEDLSGKEVGLQLGSTQQTAAKEFKNVKLKSLNKTSEVIQEVKAKKIDGAVIEDTIAKGFINNNLDLEFTTITNAGKDETKRRNR